MNTKSEIYLSVFIFDLFNLPFDDIDFFLKHVYL
jgi:hypothetical protein